MLACDLSPKTANQIDIHHLDPIAEGERKTTLDDLIPLCANCHRLAHSERPCLTLDEIKALLQEALRQGLTSIYGGKREGTGGPIGVPNRVTIE